MPAQRLVMAFLLALPLPSQNPTIRATAPLVVLSTSVTDRQGKSIDGLTSADFVLLDESARKPVNVDLVDFGLPPIALVVLVQTSARSLSALAKIRKVGAMIPEAVVGANGEVAVITFDDEVRVLEDFTRSEDAISEAFSKLKPKDSSGARTIDAIERSLALLVTVRFPETSHFDYWRKPRPGDKSKVADLQMNLQRTGVTVYSMRYSAYLTPFTTKPEDYEPGGGGYLDGIKDLARLGNLDTMEMLSRTTGGWI